MFEDVLKLVKKSCESDAAVMPGIRDLCGHEQ